MRALTWSIVLSLLRDADCVKDRVCVSMLLAHCNAPALALCASLRHRGPVGSARDDGIDVEANVRRASRGATVPSRTFEALFMVLQDLDMALEYSSS